MYKLAIAFLLASLAPASARAEDPPPLTGEWDASGSWSYRHDKFVVEVRSTVNRWMTCTVKIHGILMDTRNLLPEYRTATIAVVLPPARAHEQSGMAFARLANASWTASCVVHRDRWR